MMGIIYRGAEEWKQRRRFWPRGYRPRSVEHRAAQATKTFESLWRYAMIRLLCIFGIHWEGIVVSRNLGCCTHCGEDTYAVFIVHKLERNAHGWILRSEEHTSELQSLTNLVCRLLLE